MDMDEEELPSRLVLRLHLAECRHPDRLEEEEEVVVEM